MSHTELLIQSTVAGFKLLQLKIRFHIKFWISWQRFRKTYLYKQVGGWAIIQAAIVNGRPSALFSVLREDLSSSPQAVLLLSDLLSSPALDLSIHCLFTIFCILATFYLGCQPAWAFESKTPSVKVRWRLSVVAHSCHLSTKEAEAGRSWVSQSAGLATQSDLFLLPIKRAAALKGEKHLNLRYYLFHKHTLSAENKPGFGLSGQKANPPSLQFWKMCLPQTFWDPHLVMSYFITWTVGKGWITTMFSVLLSGMTAESDSGVWTCIASCSEE